MRQLVRSWTDLHTQASCCCQGHNVSLFFLLLVVFLQPCQRSASLEQLPFQSPPASCSLILQLCLLCTFRHYSFSPGSEPCKLRQSPSTHTHKTHGNQSCQISTSEACEGLGAITLRLPSSLCPFLHKEEDKCCDLLFWHSYQEDCASAVGSTRKSFMKRSLDQI